jgi:hypothetical protein
LRFDLIEIDTQYMLCGFFFLKTDWHSIRNR